MKAVKRIGVALAAAAATLALTSTTTQAAPGQWVRSTTDQLIAANPGAQRVSADTVRLANGVEATAGAAASCSPGYLCIYDSHNYSVSGRKLSFWRCGFVNIGADHGWSDKIRSYINVQSTGKVTIFMNWTGSQWVEVERSTAKHYKPYVDGAYNADGLWVC